MSSLCRAGLAPDFMALSMAAAPSVPDVQAAFDREAILSDGLHDRDLKILEADCRPGENARYYCQVGFIMAGEGSEQRLMLISFVLVLLPHADDLLDN